MCQPFKYENPSTHALVGELMSVGSSLYIPDDYGLKGGEGWDDIEAVDLIDHGLEHLRSAQQMVRLIEKRIKKAQSSIAKLAEEMKSHPNRTMVDAEYVCEKLWDLCYEVEGITDKSEGFVDQEDFSTYCDRVEKEKEKEQLNVLWADSMDEEA
jgi:hypothetical protein